MPRYVIVNIKSFVSENEAHNRLSKLSGEGTTLMCRVADHDEKCPGGADHVHARYDGATFCNACGMYLSIGIEKKL